MNYFIHLTATLVSLISINEAAAKITEAFANGAQDVVLADTSLAPFDTNSVSRRC